MSLSLKISANHNPHELHASLAQRGRLQVPGFLDEDSAQTLRQLLVSNDTWYLSYNQGDENFESNTSEFNALAPAQKQRFMANVYGRAQTSFQYLFKQYYISQAIELNEQPGHALHPLHDFVNSEDFLGWMRSLIGRPDVTKSDCYASRYEPGHFLTEHNDLHSTHDRVAAWVISMTPDWNPNWGGYLAFFDEKGNVETAFKPSFNTLNLFTIPQRHAVQLVAPFAGHARTSLLGWLQK